MINALMLLPLAAGLLSFLIRGDAARRRLLLWTARGHFLLTSITICFHLRGVMPSGTQVWFAYDALGLLFLGITSLLFLGASQYAVTYLALEKRDPGADAADGFIFNNAPETVFTGCLLLFLAAMTAVTTRREAWIEVR